MLEQKNDNLPQADGNQENEMTQEVQNSEIETVEDTNKKVLDEIENSNAEESEDETLTERHDIPMLDYEQMSMEALTEELEKLLASGKVASIKDHVEEIRKEFYNKYHSFIDDKKEEFASENEGNTSEFEYHFPLKNKFDGLLNDYRERKNKHYKNLEANLKNNLTVRLGLIEELKGLISPENNIQDIFRQFNDIRERWRGAGPIPKDKYNHVWNNYHFHVENFYDYIHLDREARDMDFKHNLEQKQKVIARAKELLSEPELNKAFRELQLLHRLWKEELGPVSKEYRDEIWNEFSSVTKQIHDRREQFFQQIREKEQQTLAKKQEIIAQIVALAAEEITSHSGWQRQIKKIEEQKETFFKSGKVPLEHRDEVWEAFRNATKDFNTKKNNFYKNIKAEQQDNLVKKQALIAKANQLKDSEDFAVATPVMKQIQEEWKNIGHVPKRISDAIWKEFKTACNHYFDRLHKKRNEENQVENDAYEAKKAYLDETLKQLELTGDHKTDLDTIKSHIEKWKSFGRVPHHKRYIEAKYNKVLDGLFDKLSLSKKDSEMIRYNNRINNLASSDENSKLMSERIFLSKKIDEVQQEVRQLENNKLFITGASDKNPFVAEVNKNIEKRKQELEVWKEKLRQLNTILKGITE
ncbi:MAG: DUF349 domain-containing protein [Flavobacteriaceae bacterium]